MYCSQCGAKLSDDAKFCSACGKPTVAPAVETAAVPVEETQKAVRPVKEKKTVQKANLGKKKLLGKLPLKWLLAILGGAVVLILAIVLISNAVEEKKRTTILGTIPDPETFFGVSGDHDRYDSWYEHNIEFETEDVTKDMTDAYVALLGSSEFPFVLDDTIDHFGGGMVRYIFKYNGSQELYDAQSRQIMVEYNPGYEQVVVNIRNSGNFELVPVEPYASDSVSEESTGPAYAPDPEFFFNTGAAEKGDNSMTLVLSGTPGVAVFEYISVLKDSYGMTEIDSYTEAETWQWRLQKGRDENTTVSIALDKRGDGDWDLSFLFGENVTLLQAETQSGDNGMAEPEPTPTPTPEPEVTDPSVLPDFLEHDPTGQFYMLSDSREGKAVYKADAIQVSYVVESYIDLLLDLGYTIVYEYDKDFSSSETTKRDFYHSSVNADAVLDDSKGQVRVSYNIYYDWNEVHVAIYYSDGITIENYTGYSGTDGSSGIDDFFATCSACHGSKKCTHCGGDDKVSKFQAGIGWVEQNCTFCSGGRCPTCGGTGKP